MARWGEKRTHEKDHVYRERNTRAVEDACGEAWDRAAAAEEQREKGTIGREEYEEAQDGKFRAYDALDVARDIFREIATEDSRAADSA